MIDNFHDDVFVYLVNFPNKTKEAICPNEDGTYSLFINSRLSYEDQLFAYEHAMKHILRNDFSQKSVQQIEYQVRHDNIADVHFC